MSFDLTEYAEAINSALAEGAPCVVASVGRDGEPNLGYKGSVMVFDKDHLAYWERTGGRHLENLRHSAAVAVMYYNRNRQKYLRFYGRAEIHEEGPIREQIMARVVAPELERDPERKGVAVVIEVHTIRDPFGRGTLRQND